jgi:hypothetical protein
MHFKLLIVFVDDSKTEAVIRAARNSGATGCTVVNHARGEGYEAPKSFFGLTLTSQRDVVLLLVEQHLSREILENVGAAGKFDEEPGTGIAIQIDVEDAVGILTQAEHIAEIVEEQL